MKHHPVLIAILGLAFVASPAAAERSPSAFSRALEKSKPLSSLSFRGEAPVFVGGKGEGIPAESVGDAGIALIFSQNAYWASDLWSCHGYTITPGTLTDPQGRLAPITTWQVSAPTFGAEFQFVASGNDLFFRFPAPDDYRVFSIRESAELEALDPAKPMVRFANVIAVEEAFIARAAVVNGGFTRIPEMELHRLTAPRKFFYLPASTVLRSESRVAKGVEITTLSKNRLCTVRRLAVDVSRLGRPYDTYRNQSGPGSAYMVQNKLFCFPGAKDDVSILWQDQNQGEIWQTRVGPDLAVTTKRMPASLERLGAATRDNAGNWYYLTYGSGSDPDMRLVKTTAGGKLLAQRRLSSSTRKFDVNAIGDTWDGARLHHAEGRVCLVLSRGMHSGHQGSVIATFKDSSLKIIHAPYQNASHSFDSRIIHDGRDFITLSLGDNYPRGVVLGKTGDTSASGRVVFTYRTRLGDSERDAGGGVILPPGKWSNDNHTYTELGDVISMRAGYGVLLSSEKSTSNKLITEELNESRNLAYLLVSPRFEEIPQRELIVPARMILTRGKDSPRFSFYDYGGGRVKQQNRDVVWLTRYSDKENANASRSKMVRRPDGSLLVLWEKWTPDSHVSTHAMSIDNRGRKSGSTVNLGPTRLSAGDRLATVGKRHFGVTSDGRHLEITIIE